MRDLVGLKSGSTYSMRCLTLDSGGLANSINKSCNCGFSAVILNSMSVDAILSVVVVGTVQMHMVAVHMGNNIVLHMHRFLSRAYSRPVQALPA